ncbi:SPFH domain / Band 7 family protein, partial [Vibrio parahaemolyticus V-223/04]
WFGKRCQS